MIVRMLILCDATVKPANLDQYVFFSQKYL